jgi:hypothetical protein
MSTTQVVAVGDHEFTLSPIKLGKIRTGNFLELFGKLSTVRDRLVGGIPSQDDLSAMFAIVLLSVDGDIHALTAELDNLLFSDGVLKLTELFQIVMHISGFTKARENTSGEVDRPATSTSSGSTVLSSLPLDGVTVPSTT